MRPRDAEALRLEQDYLARVRTALVGRPAEEIVEVIQALRDHIDEEAAGGPEGTITLGAVAAVIERLGPPEAYGAGMTPSTAESATATAAPVSSTSAPESIAPPVDYIHQPFEFGSIFGDAATLYGQNFLPLLLASLIYYLLMTASLCLLVGPLTGGMAFMTLRILERPDHKVDIGDMFRQFGRFWPLTGVCLILVVFSLLGFVMCVVPGVLINTLWGFAAFYIIEQKTGVFGALGASANLVLAPGRFWTNILLNITELAMVLGASAIPYLGVVFSMVLMPLVFFIWTLAYVRQTRTAEMPLAAGGNLAASTVAV
jgi:hypothetical protein